jgi:hypothetical protein
VEANSTGGQGSRRAVAPSDDDDDNFISTCKCHTTVQGNVCTVCSGF